MDKIALLERFAEQFSDKDNVSFDKYRCSRIKNTRSKCRVCTQVCPHESVKIAGKSFYVDMTSCTGCGACVTACPLGVFVLNNEPYIETAERVIRSIEATGGKPIIACETLLSELSHEVDLNKVVPVRCLDSIDEAMMTGAAALGSSYIALCHGICEACRVGTAGAVWSVVIESANALFDQWGFEPVVEDSEELPPAAFEIDRSADGISDASRREMFSDLKNQAVGFLGGIAGDALKDIGLGTMGLDQLAEETRSYHPATRAFDATRPEVVRSALLALGEPEVEKIESRFWGTVVCNHDKCKGCTMCGVYCPTGALVKRKVERENAPDTVEVVFRPSLCAQCGLCEDACRFRALTFETTIAADALVADETKSIGINRS